MEPGEHDRETTTDVGSPSPTSRVDLAHDLDPWIDRWVGAHLLSAQQAEAIRAYEAAPAPTPPVRAPAGSRPHRVPVVAEALGYMGSVLALSGLGLVTSRMWADWSTDTRLIAIGVTALVLLGAGALVRERLDPALARLRGFLWLAGTAAATLFTGVLVADGKVVGERTAPTACAATVAVASGLLWWRREQRPLQQLSFLLGLAAFVGAAMSALAGPIGMGLAVWTVGAAMLAFGLRRETVRPLLTSTIGALALLAGAALIGGRSPTIATLFGLATSVGLVVLGTRPGQVLCSAFGSVGLLVFVPWAIGWFFPGENRVPLLVIVSGVLLIGVAVLLTLMGGRFRRELPRDHSTSTA
ncbi:MAG: DUF2157 domain-containing protein [Actinobacteria bacterium]|nr:DUF2157 domain-containing protein [Actinomycetota bacterium]